MLMVVSNTECGYGQLLYDPLQDVQGEQQAQVQVLQPSENLSGAA